MAEKKKILIVTANDFLVYQPTVLALYDFLVLKYDVTIVSFEPRFISRQKDETRKVHYIQFSDLVRFIVQNFDSVYFKSLSLARKLFQFKGPAYTFFHRFQVSLLRSHVKVLKADRVIAVDIAALHVCQQIFGKCDFVSLEIYEHDPYRSRIDDDKIGAVIIQNKERLKYLFPETEMNSYIVQNAPVYAGRMEGNEVRKDLIWAGSILLRFSILDCVDFIRKFPQHRLFIKGGGEAKTVALIKTQYSDLIDAGRIVLDQGYIPGDGFLQYLSKFRIGFCFYSWELIRSSINYQTAPSGKVFMYMAAGVPVVACRIPGFAFVEEFNCGVLIDDYSAETIQRAIVQIEDDYDNKQEGCYKAAQYFSFEKRIAPYIDYVQQELG